MKQLTFSANNLGKQTPKQVQTLYRIAMVLSAIWVTVIQPNFEFSDHVIAEVNKWIVVFNGAFYHVCQYFGWSTDTPEDGDQTSGSSVTVTVSSVATFLMLWMLVGCVTPSSILAKFDKTEAQAYKKAGDPGSKRFNKYDTLKTHWCQVNAPVNIGKGKIVYLPGKPVIKQVPGPVQYVNCDSVKASGAATDRVAVPCPPSVTRFVVDTFVRIDTFQNTRTEILLTAQLKETQADNIKAWDAASKANLRATAAEGKLRNRTLMAVVSWLLLILVSILISFLKIKK